MRELTFLRRTAGAEFLHLVYDQHELLGAWIKIPSDRNERLGIGRERLYDTVDSTHRGVDLVDADDLLLARVGDLDAIDYVQHLFARGAKRVEFLITN